MKKQILSIAIAGTMIFTACHKDSVQPQNPTVSTTKVEDSNVRYFLNGETEIKQSDVQETETTTILEGFKENVVYVFENDQKLLSWCSKVNNDNTIILASKITQMAEIRAEAISRGILNDDAAIEKFMTQWVSKHPQAKIMGNGLFGVDENMGGSILILPGKLANLGGTFNNNLESYTGVTAPTFLCDYKLFGGSKKGVIGFSPSLYTFNNRAESAF